MIEPVVEDIVTKFFLNTCRLRSQFTLHTTEAELTCVAIGETHPRLDVEADIIPLITGSAAEFYIEPMLPHIGDIDVMSHFSTMLAIPRGHPPPIQLPTEFHIYVKVYEIIDSHLPGYVYLEQRYLLIQCDNDDKFNAIEYDRNPCLSNRLYDDHNMSMFGKPHGPAIIPLEEDQFETDLVHCVRHLVWPPQAADWPTRHRNYDWPDSAIVDYVVSNGCDVVPVAHRQCRQHEWMGERQWRLSFSRAEIVLINSWMPVQQIVYHMLRVFMKTEQFTDCDDSGADKLSNYHIKTLMLWACELKARIWWTDDITCSLVRICVGLLHDLAVWLAKARCPHYFLNVGNLVDSSFNLEMIRSRMISINKSWMSSWFLNNYIRKCSRLCPHNISQLFDDASTTMKLQNAVSAIVDWRLNTTQSDIVKVLHYVEHRISGQVSTHSLTLHSIECWYTALQRIGTVFHVYFVSLAFLHIARRASRIGVNDELMDVLAALVGQYTGQPRRCSNQRGSALVLNKAANLMNAARDGPKSLSTVQLIAIELSKAYLYSALKCEDSDSDSIYCLANVYLAVLYCTTEQYQTAIDHCTLVMRSQDHSQCSSHVVQGELLPKTDENIDTVLGLAAFYQHVRMDILNQQQQTYVTVFTTELFAHYLHIKCLSVSKCHQLSDTTNSQSATFEVQSCVKYIVDTQQLFIADVLLWKLVSGFYGNEGAYKQQSEGCQYPTKISVELNTSDLVELLQKSAAEHLTTFRELEAHEFGSVVTIVTTDFEALYAYKRGDYQRCLQLSTQNVDTLLYAVNQPNIPTFPEFIQLFDSDIVSLTALTLIVNPECRYDSSYTDITQLTLSLYLMTQCQLNLRHSVTSLAQTLDYIEVAQRRHPVNATLDRLVLNMIAHKALTYITMTMNKLI